MFIYENIIIKILNYIKLFYIYLCLIWNGVAFGWVIKQAFDTP